MNAGSNKPSTPDILAEIVVDKQRELATLKESVPLATLRAQSSLRTPTRSFRAALARPGLSLIAEIKKASPSGGLIRPDFDPAALAAIYAQAGAAALSVLTNEKYFQGKLEYLHAARQSAPLPILRKEFIVDTYQIVEAQRHGADAILLIVACLDQLQLRDFQQAAAAEGLDALVEVHDEAELETALNCGATLVGINNRNLKTLRTDLETTFRLLKLVPPEQRKGLLMVSESGMRTREDLRRLEDAGLDAVLIGETFMRAPDVGAKVRELLGR